MFTSTQGSARTENRVVQLQPPTYCLIVFLLTYPRRLIKPTDFSEWRYLNTVQGSAENEKIGLFSFNPHQTLQPSNHCLFILLFTYAQRFFKPTDLPAWRLLKLGICQKQKTRVVQLQQKKLIAIARVEGCIAGAPTSLSSFHIWSIKIMVYLFYY